MNVFKLKNAHNLIKKKNKTNEILGLRFDMNGLFLFLKKRAFALPVFECILTHAA